MISRVDMLATLTRRQQTEPSAVFGGDLVVRELTRAEWRAAGATARIDDETIDLDRWHGALFAAGTIDDAGNPLFTPADVASFPNRDGLWDEIGRIASLILSLSDQDADSVKKK